MSADEHNALIRTVQQPTISTNDVLTGNLPEGITGIHWVGSDWTECIDHLADPSWAAMVGEYEAQDDTPEGIPLFGEVICDMCADVERYDRSTR